MVTSATHSLEDPWETVLICSGKRGTLIVNHLLGVMTSMLVEYIADIQVFVLNMTSEK